MPKNPTTLRALRVGVRVDHRTGLPVERKVGPAALCSRCGKVHPPAARTGPKPAARPMTPAQKAERARLDAILAAPAPVKKYRPVKRPKAATPARPKAAPLPDGWGLQAAGLLGTAARPFRAYWQRAVDAAKAGIRELPDAYAIGDGADDAKGYDAAKRAGRKPTVAECEAELKRLAALPLVDGYSTSIVRDELAAARAAGR